MAQESFYGGRQGASFVIVKRFDVVQLEENPEHPYRVREYAIERIGGVDKYLLDENQNFITRTYQNEDNYIQKATDLNGTFVDVKDSETQKQLPLELKEGMYNCFCQGGATTQEVNYGEYVIIDCINSPDNGRVYRRGMDYGAEYTGDAKNPGGGAEYIGQICGPEGKIKDLEIGNYDSSKLIGEYDPTEVVSGKTNNGIKYSQENVKDDNGYIQKYIIGFQFPYFKQEWIATAGDAYESNIIVDKTPINDAYPEGEKASQAQRPQYRKYELRVPKGLPGSKIDKAGAIPVGIRGGSKLYTSPAFLPEGAQDYPEDTIFGFDSVKNFQITNDSYICFEINEVIQYARLQDCISWHSALDIIDYDNDGPLDPEQTDAGLFNYIEEITISDINASCGADHLLVWYSDSYHTDAFPSSKKVHLNGRDYIDLGYVKGEPGTSPIMGEIDSLDMIGTYLTDTKRRATKTPEELGRNYSFRGWVVTYNDGNPLGQQIQAYNYLSGPDYYWYFVGRFGGGGTNFIISSTAPIDAGVDAVWGVTKEISYFPIIE